MKGVLYIRDKTGKFVPIPAIKGAKGDKGDAGESAYTVAKANGYEGTEAEFNNALANLAEAVNAAFDASDRVGDVEDSLDGHTTDLNNPHKLTPAIIGAAPAEHTHDGRYYTEDEVNALLANKAPAHTYGTTDITAGSASSEPEGTLHLVIE